MNTIYEELQEQSKFDPNKIKIRKVVKQQDSEGNEIYTLQNSTLLEDSISFETSNLISQNSEKVKNESLFTSTLSTISGVDNLQIKTDFAHIYDFPLKKEIEKLKLFKPLQVGYNENSLRYVNFEESNRKSNNNNFKDIRTSSSKKLSQNLQIKENLQYNKENTQKNIPNNNENYRADKPNNRLFQSELPTHNQKTNFLPNPQNESTHPKTQEKFLQPQDNHKMFRSQSEKPSLQKHICNFAEDLKEFLLPKDVLKIVEEERKNLELSLTHIIKEKSKIDFELNEISTELNRLISDKKAELFSHFDNYLDKLEKNYNFFQKRIKTYKEFSLKPSNLFQKNHPIILKELKYYSNDKKLKQENFIKIPKISVMKLPQELSKKEILFLSNELDKQIKHRPLFNHSEASISMLKDLKESLLNEASNLFSYFDKLIYETELIDFKTIKLLPKLSNVISDDNLNISGDYSKVKEIITLSNSKIIETNHLDSITSMILFDPKTLITASKKGELKFWDLLSQNLIRTLENTTPIACLAILKGIEEEILGTNHLLKRMLQLQPSIESKFLLTGDENRIKIWNIDKMQIIRTLSISEYTDITSIISLNDGETIVTGSSDGKLLLWDVTLGKEKQILKENKDSITCLFLLRDQLKFVSGGSKGDIIIWKLFYDFSLKNQRISVSKAVIEFNLLANTPITCINQSFLDENQLISAGGNGNVRFWDLKQKNLIKEVKGDGNYIEDLILFENVLEKKEKEKIKFFIGSGEGNLKFWGSFNSVLKELGNYSHNNERNNMRIRVVLRGEEDVCLIAAKGKRIYLFEINH